MIKKNMAIPALFCLFLTFLCGCAAPLAMHGVSSGVPVAFNSTGIGEGDSAWFARYDDVVQATLDAGEKLSFKLEKKMIGIDQSDFYFIDEKGKKLKILIERRTETVTWARFDVGLFGSASIGRLMARQIVIEMAEADKFLRDWHPAEVD
ncbi:MAG: DUF3568 family protein [Deltaproteobacteria bacterium]|nr:DUF3568 family protein [Deltaproteobacteria bacterium]